jgi:hypothetical protein
MKQQLVCKLKQQMEQRRRTFISHLPQTDDFHMEFKISGEQYLSLNII